MVLICLFNFWINDSLLILYPCYPTLQVSNVSKKNYILVSRFTLVTGPLLVEYNAMSLNAPEALFAYCIKKDIDLPDALAISKALKELN